MVFLFITILGCCLVMSIFMLLVNPLKKSSKRPLLIQFIKILTKKFLSTSIKNKLYTLFTKKTMIYSNINNGLSKILSNSITAFPFEFHKYKSSYKIIHIFNHLISLRTPLWNTLVILPGGLPLLSLQHNSSPAERSRPVCNGNPQHLQFWCLCSQKWWY